MSPHTYSLSLGTIVALFAIMAMLLIGCSPALVNVKAPALPPAPQPQAVAIAPLDPMPELPKAYRADCPAGSGLVFCFDQANGDKLVQRINLLRTDAEYCRGAYDAARKRAGN